MITEAYYDHRLENYKQEWFLYQSFFKIPQNSSIFIIVKNLLSVRHLLLHPDIWSFKVKIADYDQTCFMVDECQIVYYEDLTRKKLQPKSGIAMESL